MADAVETDALGAALELGVGGLLATAERGGLGVGLAALVFDQLGAFSGAFALRLAAHAAAVSALERAGASDGLLESWLAGAHRGSLLVGGSRVNDALSAAHRWAPAGDAEVFVVVDDEGGVALLRPNGATTRSSPAEGLGMRGAGLSHLTFTGAPLEPVGRLEPVDRARLESARRVVLASLGVGVGRAALREARAYALERKQFGKPIADFQAIQWMLADMATELDGAGLMTLRAALELDAGQPAEDSSRAALVMTSDVALAAAQKSIQIHGGYGFVREYPVERLARDARYIGLGLEGREAARTELGRGLLDDAPG